MLVERDEELEILHGLLGDCAGGRARIAVVSGTMGIGKSALLHEFTEQAGAAGAFVMSAVAAKTESTLGLGVLDQLFRGSKIPADLTSAALRLLDDQGVARSYRASGAAALSSAPFRGLWRILRDLTERQPVVLTVDDVHHIDQESLHGLLYLIRRLRSAQLLVVMSERGDLEHEQSLLLPEILSLPGTRRLYLEPLSADGIRALLAAGPGEDFARRFAAAVYEVSGGNPIFVHALLQDQDVAGESAAAGEHAGPAAAAGLRVGRVYGRAVLRCLERGVPPILEIARGIAVLGEQASPRPLADLLDLDLGSATRGMSALIDLGVLDGGGRYRHASAATAVIGGLSPREYTALHTRAVHLLRREGASSRALARHLVAANAVVDTWAGPVLEDAARDALADGRPATATSYLRLAERIGGSQRRPALVAALAEAEWRTSPAAAARYLPELCRAVADHELTWSASVFTVASLLWHGRLAQARGVLSVLWERAGGHGLPGDGAAGFATCLLLLSRLYPELIRDRPRMCGSPRASGGTAGADRDETTAGVIQLDVMATLADALPRGDDDGAGSGAEAVLRSPRLNEVLTVPFGICLAVLACDGGVDNAAGSPDLLPDVREAGRYPGWHAPALAVRALISLRRGDLREAADRADRALAVLPSRDWGVMIGLPLAVLITALTDLGRHERLPEILRVPVPEMMFRTRVGLLYLHARGRYRLAGGRGHAAVGDFELCGRLMAEWDVDHPTLVPWRSEAARARLALGDADLARTLVEEQLSLPACDRLRPRGQSLRALAEATAEPERRRRLLRTAVEALQAAGDRFELAGAIFELSRACHELGDDGEARSLAQRAVRLFELCGVEPRDTAEVEDARAVRSDAYGRADRRERMPAARCAELSAAEQRVAALAAQGHSNRQISGMLYITISTVEQHLTRIYRKLDVNSRLELPVGVQLQDEDELSRS
jgi:DNA-binding CsgD family transcriptional regulator